MARKRHSSILLLTLLIGTGSISIHAVEPPINQRLEQLGIRQGICVVLGDPDLALEIAQSTQLQVFTQIPRARQAVKIRERMEAAGISIARMQVDYGKLEHLHLADNLADILIATKTAQGLSEKEALRVLRPQGRAWLGEEELIKPLPTGTDDWSHPHHGPDNNPVSLDRTVEAPYLTQFLANPRYGPSPQIAVAAAGRIFKAFGHVAWHPREEPYLNTLACFNGYNGTLLWTYPIPEGLMVHRNTLIATADTVYFGDDQSCKLIDARTGKVKDEIVPAEAITDGRFWKWMALENGVLYALVGEAEPMDPTKRWNRLEHGWPWTGISKGFNQQEHPWGFGRTLLAINPETKKVLWHYRESDPIDSRALCMKDGRLFAFRFGTYLTCVDTKNGNILWRKTKDTDPDLFKTMGSYLPRQSWQTNWRTAAYMKCSDQVIYFAGTQMSKLVALSAADGRLLWEHPYDNFQLILRDQILYAISGPWGDDNKVSKKFNALTGEVLAELATGRRACTRLSATEDSILFRAMGGSIRFDTDTDQPRWVSPMRPSCHDGVTIANGLLYWWPFACDCQLTLNGLTSVGAAGEFDFTPECTDSERLQTRKTVPAPSITASSNDWSTFRANNQRTCFTPVTIAEKSQVLWQRKASPVTGIRLTAPVTVGDITLVADSEGVVRAVDTRTGKPLWQAYTGGEIRIAPALWKHLALVGSGDGWVYAFDIGTGQLAWRFRAAPKERKMPVYGKLISTWPAASGVTVDQDIAYVAAGLVNYDGTYVYALDAATGKLRWCNNSSGHLDPQAQTGVSVQGHLLLNKDKLYLAGGNAVSPAIYTTRDGTCLNDPGPLELCQSTSPRGWELSLVGDRVIACGRPFYAQPDIPVYDHTVTKKILHSAQGQYDVVWIDNRDLRCYKPLATNELSRCVTDEKIPRHITQAWGEFKTQKKPLWQQDLPNGRALALTQNAVVIAQAKQVTAFALNKGLPHWQEKLTGAPVPWGMAVDHKGRVILSLENGELVCLGQK